MGYRFVRKLGVGGMGDVYLALDITADRLVALKFLRAPTNPTALDRFFREVQSLARLDHANIIRVLGHDYYQATPYFTMEYAAGGSLGAWLSRHGPADPAEAARVMATVARALHAAHEANVLHRDLKPGNILLRGDDTGSEAPTEVLGAANPTPSPAPLSALTPLVSDFGLAKRTDDEDSLTPTTGAIGTPGYIPPEQVSRVFGETDRRSDVHGLGATLYHLLTGRPPFTGPEPELFNQVLNTPPERPRVLRPEVPPGLDAVVMKCLEKKQADRFQTAAELADELEKCAAGERPVTPPLTPRRRLWRWAKRNKARLAGVALAGSSLFGVFTLTLGGGREQYRDPPRVPKPSAALPSGLEPEVAALVGPQQPIAVPAPPAMTHDQARGELRAGRRVVLIDETGLRTPAQWGVRPGTVEPIPGGGVLLRTFSQSVLELLPDPGVPAFRVRAEVRLDRKTTDGRPDSALSLSRAGVVVAYACVRPSADRVHGILAAHFGDLGPQGRVTGPVTNHLELVVRAVIEPPIEVLRSVSRNPDGVSVRLARSESEERPWRTIEVEYRPEGVTIRHGAGEATAPAGAILEEWATADRTARGASVPGRPALPIRPSVGIWGSTSQITVRRLTVEPIPQPTLRVAHD
jgi:serine/threonine protein kinase